MTSPGAVTSDDCPKRMLFGPCGGVRRDGRCEVDDRRCSFMDSDVIRWTGGRPTAPPAIRDSTPLIICDVRPAAPTRAAVRSVGSTHRFADVVLIGDHHESVDLPGTFVGAELADMGLTPWVTLSCRDRNRVALEADLVALRELGVGTAHCVTGDARAPHVRPGSTPVFDLDSHQLVALATSLGLAGSVAETPNAPPVECRAARALEKRRAGASWCFINLTSASGQLREFTCAVHDGAPDLGLIVCVGVFTDLDGARRLRALPGIELPDQAVSQVLNASDPIAAGVQRAVAAARAALDLPGVCGVNLTGPASTSGPSERAAVLAAVAEQIR